MAPPSDRQLRVLKRTILKVKEEIETLLSQKLDIQNLAQIEVLFEANVKHDVAKFEEVAHEFFLLVDENSKEDVELESKVINDQSEVRRINAMLQAKIKKANSELRGDEIRRSIMPSANSMVVDQNQSQRAIDQPKLKKIEIPEFDGDLTRFFNFKALFTNLVHNNPDFSNVQKLYYLKQALVGKAAIVLQDCDLADDAYPEAWSYFLSRYESRRAITRTFFVKLAGLQPIKSESGIREMLDQTMAIVRGLKVAGERVDETFSRYIAFLVCSKLDASTAKDWENHTCTQGQYPTFDELFKFLQGRTFVVEERTSEKTRETKESITLKASAPKKSFSAATTSSFKGKCPMCKGNHYLNQCESFKALSAHRRYELVKSFQLCIICFARDHMASSCRSNFRCKCGKPHHSLLHFEFKGDTNDSNEKTQQSKEKNESTVAKNDDESKSKKVYNTLVQSSKSVEKVILLPSAVVRFTAGNTTGTIRVLLDSCAQATMISDRLVRRYRLPQQRITNGSILGGVTPGVVSCDNVVSLSLISRTQCFELEVEAEVVPPESMDYRVYTELPKSVVDELGQFQLADPALVKKPIRISDVDMIIGAEYYAKCIENRSEKIGELYLTLSKFGWTVTGPIQQKCVEKKFSGLTLRSLEDTLKNYQNHESFGPRKRCSVKEMEKFVEHFENTYGIAADGKFDLGLPWKMEKSKIGNNRRLALMSLYRMERKLDPVLKTAYVKFMREYIAMGHATKKEPSNDGYCIPHRSVLREESSTTPVRVVFNASSKEKGQVALNEALMAGPQLQRELFDVLISVRSYCYVFSADVEKMYRMIWVKAEDRPMQKILWRESPDDPVEEYELNTVTYGTTSASFMAVQCLEVIARQIETTNAEAAAIIRNNFYMDDLLAGGDDLDQVKVLRKVIHDALAVRGFHLRKYSANVPELISDLPNEALAGGSDWKSVDKIGMLGVAWSPKDDEFRVKINVKWESLNAKITKRSMMSVLAQTFDPLGMIAPVSVRGKLMIQELWKLGMDWDISVPPDIAQKFETYILELSKLEKFRISRYLGVLGTRFQIVGFCDASAQAYCAVLYVRAVVNEEVNGVRLVCAKTRVAPTKATTIPKMELSAAVLLAELLDRVRKNLNVVMSDCFLFTDATIVLCWLSQPPSEWRTFVSNRVEKINNLFPYSNWFYVNTGRNPADLATRGLSVAEFLNAELWFEGPDFLKNFPILSDPIPNWDLSEALERRKSKVLKVVKFEALEPFINKYSSMSFMLRVLAFVLRFVDGHRERHPSVVLTSAELSRSRIFALRMVQHSYFLEDISRLSDKLALKAGSKILPLTPFLDTDRILRVGGRLSRSSLSETRKHPVILPAGAHFTRVLVRDLHERYFHAGKRFLMAFLASRYWLVGGCSNLVKSVI